MATTLFISEEYIKTKTPITNNIDVKFIIPQIEFAQDTYIQNILGSKFYDSLQIAYSAQTLDVNQTYLVGLIKPALAYRAAEQAIPFIHIQIRNSGTVKLNADNQTQQSTMEEMKYVRQILVERAEFYEKQITNYLINNPILFADYIIPDYKRIAPTKETPTTCDLYFKDFGVYNRFSLRTNDLFTNNDEFLFNNN